MIAIRYGLRALECLLLAACLGVGGCATIAAHYIETPGHHGPDRAMQTWLARDTGYVQRDFTTASGLRVAYWYSPPELLDIRNTFSEKRVHGVLRGFSAEFHLAKSKRRSTPPALRGSVVLLHPWGQNAAQMSWWGVHFSNAGYVTVMPALRSQGDSGDAPVGYGPREAGDVTQLIRALQKRHELPPPLYLFGVSYGATVALFAAPQLPQVRGVVALEPYARPVDVIMHAPAVSWLAPPWLTRFLSPHVMQDVFSPRVMHKAIRRADRKLGIDLADIDPGSAVAASHACTLLLRGSDDVLIADSALRALAARSPRADYVEVPDEGHISLFFRSDLLFPPILAWMQSLSPDANVDCPAFALAAAPTPQKPAQTSAPQGGAPHHGSL